MLTRLWPSDLILGWTRIWPVLRRAVKRSPNADQLEVLQRLCRGEFQCFEVSGEATGFVVTSVGPAKDGGAVCLWPKFAAGHIKGDRKAAVRQIMGEIEIMAKADGCAETRIEAVRAGWSRFFPDYELTGRDGGTVFLRKVL